MINNIDSFADLTRALKLLAAEVNVQELGDDLEEPSPVIRSDSAKAHNYEDQDLIGLLELIENCLPFYLLECGLISRAAASVIKQAGYTVTQLNNCSNGYALTFPGKFTILFSA